MTEKCLFCDNQIIIRNPDFADRFKKKGTSPIISTVDGDLKVKTRKNTKRYFSCSKCEIDYIPIKIDLELLLSNLQVKANVSVRLDYFYLGISLNDLILKHRTGIAKKPEDAASWVSKDLVKRQLLMGFNYNEVRTIGTFIRKKKTKDHYTMTMLEMI